MQYQPFWAEDPSKVHEIDQVLFQSTLIKPIGETGQPDIYPLVIWFAGLGPSGLDGIGVECGWLSRMITRPFVLVAPIRRSTTWWMLDDHRPPWGCVTGSLLTTDIEIYAQWIRTIARTPGIDHNSVSVFGGSAGAYAVTEIIANSTCALHCVGLCSVHGHGQPDLDGLDEKRRKRSDEIAANWEAYIRRLSTHRMTPKILVGVHNPEDTCCVWKYAQEIYKALDHSRMLQHHPPTRRELVTVQVSKKRSSHNYGPQAWELFLQHAFGKVERCQETVVKSMGREATETHTGVIDLTSDDERSSKTSQVVSPFSPTQSLCTGASQSVGSGEESLGRGRSRSRCRTKSDTHAQSIKLPQQSPSIMAKCDNTAQQCSLLPEDHILHTTLSSGVQALCIVHCNADSQDLWSNAMNIGSSASLVNLQYFDDPDDNALCDAVRSALSAAGNLYANQFFMCTKVGDLVAVGIAGNKKNRTRTARIAAALCFELQSQIPRQEFQQYASFQILAQQVKSCCKLGVI